MVESETALNKTITEGLSELGYQTDDAESIKDALYFISIRNYDLIIINWLMDGGDVRELIETIKRKSNRMAVILLAARAGKEDEIDGLRAGADDYLKKPFDFDVLVARIEAKLRFGGTSIIEIEDLVIDPDEEKITFKGIEIELKGKPFEVLTHLARHRDLIVSKEQLLDAIWEEPELVTPNVIEVAINQIRQKMDKPLEISTIETVRRRGYRFCYPKPAEEL
ncbi:MAG TPA: homeostatic response regulator transcription factor HsrA [Campylobacterales bacterium]|nr:homeostatic response regulator transcription factor HsrA [Campylobacterales bacterium]